MSVPLKYFAKQIIGRRSRQEDAWKVIERDGCLIAAVADGLGGHPGGDVASLTAVEGLAAFVDDKAADFAAAPVATLAAAAEAIDLGLREVARRHPQLEGMATTLAMLYVTPERVYRLSVGDSLIYRCVRGRFWRWNKLHEAETGYLTSCLGSAFTDVDCPARGTLLKSGDRYLIASDGIEVLTEGHIGECLAQARTPQLAVAALLDSIKQAAHPYQDNTTLLALFAE